MTKKAAVIEKADESFLSSYLPYLLNRVAMEMLRGADEKFSRFGLSVAKWRTLAVLSDVGSCTFGELVHLTSVEPATLSRMVGGLATAGLVRRRKHPSDARSISISLTSKGAQLFEDTLPWSHEVEDTLVQDLSAAEVRRLKQVLKKVYLNVYRANAGTRKPAAAAALPHEVWLPKSEEA